MFNKTDNDITRTLTSMISESIDQAKYNQAEAQKLMAKWVANDRRFDGYDPMVVAKDAFDAKTHGRLLRLDQPYRPHSHGGGFTSNV